MTIQEAARHLSTSSNTNGSGQTTSRQHNEAKEMAIRSLEAWKKAKEEIEEYIDVYSADSINDVCTRRGLKLALKEINKHLSEVEDEE